jgi:hypothetical protein
LIKFDEGVRRPDVRAQLFPADDLPGIFQQELKDLEGLFLQFDLNALFAQFRALQVELKNPKLYNFRAGVLRWHCQRGQNGVYHRSSDPRQKPIQVTAKASLASSETRSLTATHSTVSFGRGTWGVPRFLWPATIRANRHVPSPNALG